MSNHIMLDLETLGTSPGSVITSIGAVRFVNTGWRSLLRRSTFQRTVDIQSCIDAGLTVDADTIKWWMEQPDEARMQFQNTGQSLEGALRSLARWMDKPDEIWGNGSDFDNSILASAYKTVGMPYPWKGLVHRCYRTIKKQHPEILLERVGTHHVAVDDAKSQANHLIACLKSLKPILLEPPFYLK